MANKVLFSPVQGVVLSGGQPVAGARIDREFIWAWKDEKGGDSTVTDAAGRFSFPEIARSSFFGSFLPHEISVQQAIYIRHAGQTYDAWFLEKKNYDALGEIGRPIVLTCALETPKHHSGDVFGICELN